MLHILRHSPVTHVEQFTTCAQLLADHDVVLLIEDAVYLLVQESPFNKSQQLFALAIDVYARELSDRMIHPITLLNDSEFVDLTINHNPIQTW